jgi:hypothetical protein
VAFVVTLADFFFEVFEVVVAFAVLTVVDVVVALDVALVAVGAVATTGGAIAEFVGVANVALLIALIAEFVAAAGVPVAFVASPLMGTVVRAFGATATPPPGAITADETDEFTVDCGLTISAGLTN